MNSSSLHHRSFTASFRLPILLLVCAACLSTLLVQTARAAENNPATSAPASTPAPATLENVEWTLTELKGKPAPPGVAGSRRGPASLRLDAGKKQASGFSGVNRFFGSYEREGDGEKLKFGPLAGTRMAGPPEAMAFETEFLAMLGSVTHFRVSDAGILELLQNGTVVARFTAAKAAEK